MNLFPQRPPHPLAVLLRCNALTAQCLPSLQPFLHPSLVTLELSGVRQPPPYPCIAWVMSIDDPNGMQCHCVCVFACVVHIHTCTRAQYRAYMCTHHICACAMSASAFVRVHPLPSSKPPPLPSVPGNPFGVEGLKLVAERLAGYLGGLQRLDLRGTDLDVRATPYLARVLQASPQLTYLSLSENPLGQGQTSPPPGAAHLLPSLSVTGWGLL